jgi:hypothetical protein
MMEQERLRAALIADTLLLSLFGGEDRIARAATKGMHEMTPPCLEIEVLPVGIALANDEEILADSYEASVAIRVNGSPDALAAVIQYAMEAEGYELVGSKKMELKDQYPTGIKQRYRSERRRSA